MESANEKEVEKIGTREGVSTETSSEVSIDEKLQKGPTIREKLQPESIHTETEIQLDTEPLSDAQAVAEPVSDNASETNTEISNNQETDITTCYSKNVQEDKPGFDNCEDQTSDSPGNEADFSQARKITEERDCAHNLGENVMSTDAGVSKLESGKEELKTAAAVITQENYENTLRCQSNEMKNEEIDTSYQDVDAGTDTQHVNAESDEEKENLTIDSPVSESMEEKDSIKAQSDLMKGNLENDACIDKEVQNIAFIKENNEANNEDKQFVSISDDDSLKSVSAKENHTTLESPSSSQDTNLVSDEFQKKPILNQIGDVISIDDDDDSQASDKSCDNTKDLESNENEKNEANVGSALVLNFASDNNSKDIGYETTQDNINDAEGDSNIQLQNFNTGNLNVADRSINDELDTTHSSEESLTNDNDKMDTSVDEETEASRNEMRIKLKLNGDYKSFPSPASHSHAGGHIEHTDCLEEDTRKATIQEEKKAKESLNSDSDAAIENAAVCDMEIGNESKFDSTISSQLNSTASDINQVEHEDESSQCSSLASAESNSSGTSSSHQLVIDHPMEELDAASSLPGQETGLGSVPLIQAHLPIDQPIEELDTAPSLPSQATDLRCVPLLQSPLPVNRQKVDLETGVLLPSQEPDLGSVSTVQAQEKSDKGKRLKRKLSTCSEHGLSPQRKQPHLELEPYDSERKEIFETVQQTVEHSTINNSTTDVEHMPFKSLLLQRLQKPYTPPPPPSDHKMSPTTSTSLFTQPLEKSSFNISQPILRVSDARENINTATKYLCFKCKTGCFDSFAALNEHQRECLADTRLLPTRIAEISSILPISLPPVLATPPPSASPDVTVDLAIADVASQSSMSTIVPSTSQGTPGTVQKKRYYKCSSCNTFHENWNLFLHIRDKHQRHMCIYCIRFFPTAEKLSVHLEIKHDLEQIHFNSEEALRKSVPIIDGVLSEKRFLMCCTCQHLFEETEPFSDHNCAEFMKPCTLCGQKGRHSNQCKAHPDAKRTSRTKKKSKKIVIETAKTVKSRSHLSFPFNSVSEAKLKVNSFNCDSNQPTLIVPTDDYPAAPVATLHNEDSNSSSNMVIDESCTTIHSSLVNPFKELDERWRLEQQSQNRYDSGTCQARDPSPDESKLTVPKFKLRVPKEFQKSVDVALSSTDSDEDDDDINEDESTEVGTNVESSIYKNDNSVASTTSELPHLQTNNNLTTEHGNEQSFSHKRIDDDNIQETPSVDKDEYMDDTNPNLVRILQEIERTKLDIQRTKETLHHVPVKKLKHGPPAEATAASEHSTLNWTPTPPTSPKQSRCLLPQSDLNQLSTDAEAVKPEVELTQPLERKDSQGSDAMDIDETITGQPSEQPPRETIKEESQCITTDSTATELNTSNGNTSSNSTNTPAIATTDEKVMDIDRSPLKQDGHALANVDDETCIQMGETNQQALLSDSKESLPDIPADGIEVANEDVLVIDLQLDRPLEKIEVVEFVRLCLKAVYPICLYCNHARRIAVNGQSLVLHMLAQHRFSATVDSITAEELKPETICAKLKTFLPILENEFFNSTSYCTMGEGIFTRHFNERIFECFQCRFVTSTHKELYLHNRKMHLKTAILCFMCRANFFSFSEILCHICPGAPNKTPVFDVKFRCCLCDLDNIPSPFRLMVHLRKRHFACDVCLEDCRDQGRLSSHVWKHKLHHVCYRCGIAYRNKMDITKHLFWKHGTESIICKRCLQKRWRHVYHFCVPPITFNCDICNLCFSKAMYLKVHKRLHSGDLRYPCTEENCDDKFVSRKLLLKHTATHMQQETVADALQQSRNADVDMKSSFDPDREIKAEGANKPTDQEKEKDKMEMDIKNEMTGSATEMETASVKCEKSECIPKAKTENKPDVKVVDVENLDHSKEAKTNSKEEKGADAPRKKKKKNKRSKESLEDLNLIAPNLSETDSSDESDIDSKSRGDDNSLVPKVMLSPPSEAENDSERVKKSEVDEMEKRDSEHAMEGKDNIESGTGNVLEIWKNFLQTQQGSTTTETNENATLKTEANKDDKLSIQDLLKVIYADHDYCKAFRPPSPMPPAPVEKAITPSLSPTKRNKVAKSPRRASNRRSASSSSSDSSSTSDSSCSCGSNCSCSSSGSHSSSSSSSSDDSDSSVASNTSRKRHRKKSDRERSRKKSESVSPLKKHTNSETVNVVDDDLVNDVAADVATERIPSPPKELQIYESDLETAESETDEEFYDEHPQKLASELLAQKRAQLMAQTRLSPSHNFDIVENSRPSTPSLPEDVICETTRVKMKKKKRDRKSSGKANAGQLATKTKGENKSFNDVLPMPLSGIDLPSYELNQSSPIATESSMTQHHNVTMPYSSLTLPAVEQLTPRPIAPHMPGRVSEGSSCSDLDGSLKRSKRARRPNKFYGYTSDDDNSIINLGQPLMMGMRAIKPQPPPQLTWRKEDLPTPAKSIVNPKSKATRTPKTPSTPVSSLSRGLNSPASTSTKKKRFTGSTEKSATRKRVSKKTSSTNKLPPIPTLKIRPSQLGIGNDSTNRAGTTTEHFPTSQIYSSSKETDDDDDENNNSSEASSDGEAIGAVLPQTNSGPLTSTSSIWNSNSNQTTTSPDIHTQRQLLQLTAPQPVLPTPQATVFNHKIPPALLPNPNFETLQYFKANNIRYPIRPPAGARQAREGESVYCYCRCPYDEVSEMIACDGENCLIEWFHFECVGIMVAPQGKWFCAECRPKYSEELYPTTGNV